MFLNPLSAKLTKWLNTLKQFVGNLPTNCLSVFGHFVGLAIKGLTIAVFIFKNPCGTAIRMIQGNVDVLALKVCH